MPGSSDVPAKPPLLILGGTFDPPHIGHLVLAECARHQFGAPVVFLPAGDPWRKSSEAAAAPRAVTPAAERVAMTRLAIAGNEGFLLDEREARRQGPTYTADTLQELHASGHDEIVLILGRDSFDDMVHWKDPERITGLATLAIAPRAGDPSPAGDRIVTVEMPPLAITSTDIRTRVGQGKPIRYLVPLAVEEYIREHRLYLR